MLEIPCSRVSHIWRKHNKERKTKDDFDYVTYNFKRIAETWLDEYKEALYSRSPERYAKIDAGDLTRVKRIKAELNCKPFQYFLDYVAPDLAERFPPFYLGDFAKGVIKSDADPNLCVDSLWQEKDTTLSLAPCHANLTHPFKTQSFALTWHRQLMYNDDDSHCISTYNAMLWYCQFDFDKQYFKYDLETHQLVNPPFNDCLSAALETKKLEVKKCNKDDINQKWTWGYTNVTALQNWDTFGVRIPKA